MHHKLTEAKISSLAKNLCSDSMHHKLTEAKISSLAKNLCLDSMHQILKTAEEPSLAKNNAHIHSHINIIGQRKEWRLDKYYRVLSQQILSHQDKLTEAKISSLAKNLCSDSMHQILKTAEESSLAKNNAHILGHINIIGQKGRSGG
jgi:hypothetical protein